MSKTNQSEKVPQAMQPVFSAIVKLTDEFSARYLNDEYAQLIRHATAALCRKRQSPLSTGKINTWACGITYAIGSVNFLFDKSQEPYCSAADLCEQFAVSKSGGAAKAKIVKDALKMGPFDPDWCLPSRLNDNPLAWMIMVNGMLTDARYLPREIQEIAFQKGLIPFIPEAKIEK
jgi:hypothetical protein